jgi:BMFP domain-containing protein YqiC
MIDPKKIDELVKNITDGLPGGFEQVRDDLRKNLHTVLSAALARMDLVSRDEFDVQAGVLARTRAKLTSLEAKVAELERAHGHADRPGQER